MAPSLKDGGAGLGCHLGLKRTYILQASEFYISDVDRLNTPGYLRQNGRDGFAIPLTNKSRQHGYSNLGCDHDQVAMVCRRRRRGCYQVRKAINAAFKFVVLTSPFQNGD